DMAAYGGGFLPAIPSMMIERAQSKIQLGMLREAESDCLEAIRLLEEDGPRGDPNYIEPVRIAALDRLSRIYRSLGEVPLAIEEAQQSLKLSVPRNAENEIYNAWRFLAEVHGDLGQLRVAEEYLEKVSRMSPPFNAAPIFMAELHLNFGLYEEALRDLDRADQRLETFYKIRPNARRHLWWGSERFRLLTELWLRLGEPEKALVTAKTLEERNHPVEQGMLGIALTGLGRYSEAEKYFQARLDSLKGAAWPQKEVDAVLNLGKI